jgi:hypothetical protein
VAHTWGTRPVVTRARVCGNADRGHRTGGEQGRCGGAHRGHRAGGNQGKSGSSHWRCRAEDRQDHSPSAETCVAPLEALAQAAVELAQTP